MAGSTAPGGGCGDGCNDSGRHTVLVRAWPEACTKGTAANRKAADAFAANVLPVVRQIQAAGVTGLRGLAVALNDRGVRTARGGMWHASTVGNLLARGA
jgi:hypothetical protein